MAENSNIPWTHHTFNGWIGCSHVHAGCINCYAEEYAKKLGIAWGPNGVRRRTTDENWRQPYKWNRDAAAAGERRRVFAFSLADVFEDWTGAILDTHFRQLFHGDHPALKGYCTIEGSTAKFRSVTMTDLRRDLFAIIDGTPWLDWLILTKRPENIALLWPPKNTSSENWFFDPAEQKQRGLAFAGPHKSTVTISGRVPRENVWLLTSISDQLTAEHFIPLIADCADLVPVVGVSAEPLLSPIHLAGIRGVDRLLWGIVGGESGGKRRDCGVVAITDLVKQFRGLGIAAYTKQDCSFRPDTRGRIPPEVWAIREYPQPLTTGTHA